MFTVLFMAKHGQKQSVLFPGCMSRRVGRFPTAPYWIESREVRCEAKTDSNRWLGGLSYNANAKRRPAKLSVFSTEGGLWGDFALRGLWQENLAKRDSKITYLKNLHCTKSLWNSTASDALRRGEPLSRRNSCMGFECDICTALFCCMQIANKMLLQSFQDIRWYCGRKSEIQKPTSERIPSRDAELNIWVYLATETLHR